MKHDIWLQFYLKRSKAENEDGRVVVPHRGTKSRINTPKEGTLLDRIYPPSPWLWRGKQDGRDFRIQEEVALSFLPSQENHGQGYDIEDQCGNDG